MILLMHVVMITFFSQGATLELYQQREKAYQQWLQDRDEEKKRRESAANEVRLERGRRELDAIRRRQQFKRIIRTTQASEGEHLQKLEKLEKERLKTREIYGEKQKQARSYYEKHILPMKMKEYGLDQPHE